MANLSSYLPDGIDESSVQITGGTINGTTLGASTAAAGTFTTVTGSGDLAIDTDTLFVDVSADKVGIGTTSPSHKLDVTGGATDVSMRVGPTSSSGANDGTLIINNGGTGDAMLRFDYESGNTDRARIGVSASGQQLEFYTAGDNERMRITSDGLVGIGTDSPSDRLHVKNGSAGSVPAHAYTQFNLEHSTHAAIQFSTPNTAEAGIVWGDPEDADAGGLFYYHASNYMYFRVNGGEEMRLESDGDLHVDGNVVAYSTTISDERLKDDVQNITGALDTVDALRGVTYTWNTGSREGKRDYGVIAQEVEQVIPEIVHDTTMPLLGDEETVYKTVDYEKLCAVLINAVSELRAEVEALKNGTSV